MFDRIPQEMRSYPQWVVWRYEDTNAPKPTKYPYSARTGKLASVTDPDTWATYDEAIEATSSGWYSGIGFVLTNADPYTFIDLDDTKGNKEDYDRQLKIYQEFDSFAELSPSGKGLHIIVKGSIESGRRRSHIEIYSSHRYMTMTGNVYRDSPIKDYNDLLQVLWSQMGQGKGVAAYYAGIEEAKETDGEVYAAAANAANGEKFVKLYSGDWSDYPPNDSNTHSSEADLALINIIAYYTQNREQIARMFRASGLGQRKKASRNDYVNWMLNMSFDQMLPPVDIDGLRNELEAHLAKKIKGDESARLMLSADSEKTAEPGNYVAPASPPSNEMKPLKSIYNPPPGLVGELAQFIYAQAPRPVPEIALVGALGLLAGIVGRAYNISGTGLNQYILLLAPTGTGKEAIARGIDKLMSSIAKSVPASSEFIGPGEIASSQALIKYMAKSASSFVSVVGEYGIQLKMMASPHSPPHMVGLMRLILDLYNKSGEGNVLRPSIYSDREKNTASVLAPAFTILGESTPEKFYEALDESMITSGLLPRFTIVEYLGDRPPLNDAHIHAMPSFDLIERLATVCAHALTLNSQHKSINVEMSSQASSMFSDFDKHCDANINGSNEIRRNLWNRAHVKAMKLAAIVAVGCNPYEPTVDVEIATWALNIVVADVRNVLNKFDAGEIGVDNDETKQLTTAIKVVREFVTSPFSEVEKYVQGMGHLHGERIIPYSYLQRRLVCVAIFKKDRRGASEALKRTLKTLCERGDLQEVSKATLSKNYNTTALCYMIAVPRVFGL